MNTIYQPITSPGINTLAAFAKYVRNGDFPDDVRHETLECIEKLSIYDLANAEREFRAVEHVQPRGWWSVLRRVFA